MRYEEGVSNSWSSLSLACMAFSFSYIIIVTLQGIPADIIISNSKMDIYNLGIIGNSINM